MKRLVELTADEARAHFLKGSTYFSTDLPAYLNFSPVLKEVAAVLEGGSCQSYQRQQPEDLSGVNYDFIANKDGKFAWRPIELIHPALYVSLVNALCDPQSWAYVTSRLRDLDGGCVDCCSAPVMSMDHQSDVATQVKSWWMQYEQQSLAYSLEYSHLLQTDVTDCYGALYTPSIAWALHGKEVAMGQKGLLLGHRIEQFIQAGRMGQTNGIPQGTVLMDFIAEIVLAYVDQQISRQLAGRADFKILRYRDDFRIFTHNDTRAEEVLKVVSNALREVGMKLGVAKTSSTRNIVEGSVKPDKLAGIELQDLGQAHAKSIQKQLMRLHAFGQRFPNSGALRRLMSDYYENVYRQKEAPADLEVQIAIATDIGFVSPSTFPAVAGILSHLIALAPNVDKTRLWTRVRDKMRRLPYNGYLEIWLQRVTRPSTIGIRFDSDEPLCQIVNGDVHPLWNSRWIIPGPLLEALNTSRIVVSDPNKISEEVVPNEVQLFRERALTY